jgi:hypothetical protein
MAMPPHSVPLVTDAVVEPIYVNARQYHGILRRRQSRAKAESENKANKIRKVFPKYYTCLSHIFKLFIRQGETALPPLQDCC